MAEPRMTLPTLTVLRVLDEHGERPLYGYDLMRRADLKSGTLYPILARLERLGHLRSEWEPIDPTQEGRPARRMYTLTPSGKAFAQESLKKAQQALAGRVSHAS